MDGTQPKWTEAEHREILRLHIIEGLTIDEAMLKVFQQRVPSDRPG